MLGSFRVTLHDRPIENELSGKPGCLLKILAAHRRNSLTRDALIEMLWPDADPAAGYSCLKVAAHNLRKGLEPERKNGDPGTWIAASNATYRLKPTSDVWIDVEDFEDRWLKARASEGAGRLREAQAEYQTALGLYAGDYLEEDTYDDWTIIRREGLRDIYVAILGKLANLFFNEQVYDEAINYCHKIIVADPCREDVYRMLMLSHVALNQLARVGSWYAVCRTMLRREMGEEPSRETVELFESLFSRLS